MTAAIYAFAALTRTDLATAGRRVMVADLVAGDLTLDPRNETFLPRYVYVVGNHVAGSARLRTLVVRPVLDSGDLGRVELVRDQPHDVTVTAWHGPAEPEVG